MNLYGGTHQLVTKWMILKRTWYFGLSKMIWSSRFLKTKNTGQFDFGVLVQNCLLRFSITKPSVGCGILMFSLLQNIIVRWNGKYEHSPIRISASCLYIYIKMTRMGKVQVIVTISESRTTHIIRGSYQLQSSTGKAHLAEESKFR